MCPPLTFLSLFTLTEHESDRHSYDTMWQHFYWQHIGNDVYTLVCKISLLHLESISSCAWAESSAHPSCRTHWARRSWYFITTTEDIDKNSTCRRDNRQFLEINTGDLQIPVQLDTSWYNIFEQSGHAIWYTFICYTRPWAAICEQNLHNRLPISSAEEVQHDVIPPADEWPGWTL